LAAPLIATSVSRAIYTQISTRTHELRYFRNVFP